MSEDLSFKEDDPNAVELKAVAMNDHQASTHIFSDEDEVVAVMTFGIFKKDEFEKMGFAGASPTTLIGSSTHIKTNLEPFFVIGSSEDTKLMLNGFITQVFDQYLNDIGSDEEDTNGTK